MVDLEIIRASNAALKNLGSGLVAVFVGGTSGIGEYTLKAFVEHTISPRVYIVGRNENAARRIAEEAKQLNESSFVHFIKSDVLLLRNVDAVCKELQAREEKINLLFMSPGVMSFEGRSETSEGIDKKMALFYYARMRFAHNLLPQLTAAANAPAEASPARLGLSRIVSVHAPGREGDLIASDLDLRTHYGFLNFQKHAISMHALFLEELARRHPQISTVNSHPGTVPSGLLKRHSWALALLEHVVMNVAWLLGKYLSPAESGERNLYAATADALGPRETGLGKDGMAVGSDGERGSGAYLVGSKSDRTGKDAVLQKLREKGSQQKVWEHTLEMFESATEHSVRS